MKIVKVAHRYAKALYELAAEQNLSNEVLRDMLLVRQVGLEKPFKNMMSSMIIPAAKKIKVTEVLFNKKVQPLTLAFLKLLIQKNRARTITQITIEYEGIYNLKNQILATEIESVATLDKDIRKSLTDTLKKQTDSQEIALTEKINKDLIGGFVLRYQNMQYDASVKRQLSGLRKTLT